MTTEFSLYIDGEAVASKSGKSRTATNPATGETIAYVPEGTREDARRAAAAAARRTEEFRTTTIQERGSLLRSVADALADERDDLTEWLTVDQGKPIHEARGEVDGAIANFRHMADAATQMKSEVLPGEEGIHQYTRLEPHGVVGIITPWNFPVNLPAEHLSAAIAAGNTVIWLPAPTTTTVGLALGRIITDVLPDGIVNVVAGEGTVVGDQVVRDENTHAIGFTGSPATGEQIHKNAGLKPMVLELGGNGPVIIMDDADLDQAIERAAFSCFNNAGQVCSSSERLLVHSNVEAAVTERLLEKAAEYTPGDPLNEDTKMGPLNNPTVKEKMHRHIDDAVEKGGNLVYGGPEETDSLYQQPTVLTDLSDEMDVMREETFGPIAPIMTIDSIDEAIHRANQDNYGLSSSLYTTDLQRAHEFIDRVHAGMAKINVGPQGGGTGNLPYGGYTGTRSGLGRLGGQYGIESYSQRKTVVIDHSLGQ